MHQPLSRHIGSTGRLWERNRSTLPLTLVRRVVSVPYYVKVLSNTSGRKENEYSDILDVTGSSILVVTQIRRGCNDCVGTSRRLPYDAALSMYQHLDGGRRSTHLYLKRVTNSPCDRFANAV